MPNQKPNAKQSVFQEPQVAKSQKHQRFLWIVVSLLGVALIVLGLNFFSEGKDPVEETLSSGNETISSISQKEGEEPLPFREMTVPYLRARTYKSSLGDREVVTQGSNYTGYLTSFDSDGFRVNGLLTIPQGEVPEGGWPGIVFVHGYIPPSQYGTLDQYADYVDYLARNGFVVFKIDLRGHGNSEGEAGGGYYGSDYIVDTLNARAALAASDVVNPDSIGLWGHSMAGNVVLRSMAARPEIPASVVWAGAVFTYDDWNKYGIDDNSYRPPDSSSDRRQRRQQLLDTHGRYSEDSEFWQQVTPKNYLGDLRGAIQLNHATNDPVVNVGYSRDLRILLEDEGVEHELNFYDGGGHNIEEPYFTDAMENTVAFFKEYL